jgi:hypothetical protein
MPNDAARAAHDWKRPAWRTRSLKRGEHVHGRLVAQEHSGRCTTANKLLALNSPMRREYTVVPIDVQVQTGELVLHDAGPMVGHGLRTAKECLLALVFCSITALFASSAFTSREGKRAADRRSAFLALMYSAKVPW